MSHSIHFMPNEAVAQMKHVLAPLNKLTDIHYFCYGVNLPDTSGFSLHTHADFYDSWFEYRFPLCGFHLPGGWYFWDTILPPKQIEIANHLDLGKGIIHIRHQPDKTEVFSFASWPDNNKVDNFYLNHLHLLKKYTHYFIEKSASLIDKAYQHRIIPLPEMILKEKSDPLKLNNEMSDPQVEQFLEELSFPLNLLSERETECYQLLMRGFSLAEISKKLNLAIPTVAVYVTRIKQKLKCLNKHQLIQKAHEWGIVEFKAEALSL